MIDVERILQLDYLKELLFQIDKHIAVEKGKIIRHYDIDTLESMNVDEISSLFKKYGVNSDKLLSLIKDKYLDETFEYAEFYADDISYSMEQLQLLREEALKEIELLNSKIDLVNEQINSQVTFLNEETKFIDLIIKLLKSDGLIYGTNINEIKKMILSTPLLKDSDRVQATLSLVNYLIESGRKILFNKENVESASFEQLLDSVHKSSTYNSEDKSNMNTKLPYYDVVLNYYDRYKNLFDETGYTDIFELMPVADSLCDGVSIEIDSINRENFCIYVANLLYQLNFIDDKVLEKETLDMLLKLDALYDMDMKLDEYKKQKLVVIEELFSKLESLNLDKELSFVLDMINKIKNRLMLVKKDLENKIISDIKKENIDVEFENIKNSIDILSDKLDLLIEIDSCDLKIRNIFANPKNKSFLTDDVSNLLVDIQSKLLDFKDKISDKDITNEMLLEIKSRVRYVDELELNLKKSVELPKEENKIVLNGFVLCDFDENNQPYVLSDLDPNGKNNLIDESMAPNDLNKGYVSYNKLLNDLFLLGNTEKLSNNDNRGLRDRLNEAICWDLSSRDHDNETGMYRLKNDVNGAERFIEKKVVIHYGTVMYDQVVGIIREILPNIEFVESKDISLYLNFASAMKVSDTKVYSVAINRYRRKSPLYKMFIEDKNKEQLTDNECKLLKDIINMSLDAFLKLEEINPNLHFDVIKQMGGVKTRG